MRRLLDQTPRDGQRLLFSATLDKAIDVLVKKFLNQPVTHEADSAQSPISTMSHHVLHLDRSHRLPVLVDLASAPGRTVVFTRTKHGAKALARQLNKNGIPSVDLHGNLSQGARTRNMEAFHSGKATTLVATDIAARGIHVDDVALVVHADPPVEHKAYLHRSGRTARAGAAGTVITLMTDEQVRDVRALTRAAGIKPTTTRISGMDHPILVELAPGVRSLPGGLEAEAPQPQGAPRSAVAVATVAAVAPVAAAVRAARATRRVASPAAPARSPRTAPAAASPRTARAVAAATVVAPVAAGAARTARPPSAAVADPASSTRRRTPTGCGASCASGRNSGACRARRVDLLPPTTRRSPLTDPTDELDIQIDRLVGLGYPALAGLDEAAFRAVVEPLRGHVATLPGEDLPAGRTSFVLVVTRDLVRPEDTVPLLHLAGSAQAGQGRPQPRRGRPRDVPPAARARACRDAPAYLLVDVDRGEEFCGVRPEAALPVIRERGRTPLTIDEGIAVVTHAPQLLEKNKCFMLSGSRRHDRRVPAMWISERAPKLGWCWDGNPHTWLGVASAGDRKA